MCIRDRHQATVKTRAGTELYRFRTQQAAERAVPLVQSCTAGTDFHLSLIHISIMLMTIQMAKEISDGSDDFSSVGAVLMAWMSGGTVLGGILALSLIHI